MARATRRDTNQHSRQANHGGCHGNELAAGRPPADTTSSKKQNKHIIHMPNVTKKLSDRWRLDSPGKKKNKELQPNKNTD